MQLRSWLRIAGALLVLSVATAARAEQNAGRPRFASPQYFAIELKFGPYAPSIDREFKPTAAGTQAHPFKDIFGSGRMLMMQTEIDVQLLHAFGSLGVGLSVGYGSKSGATCLDNGSTTTVATCTATDKLKDDHTKLSIIPLAALAVYRFDVLADYLHIPLVPYIKFGANYSLWSMRNSSGEVSSYTDGAGKRYRARGGVWGWQLDAGLALRLDSFDLGAARKLDAETGVNHTYLVAELHHVATKQLPDLGETTFLAGLLFEF